MSPDKDKQIFEHWPQFFKHRHDPYRSCMGFGIWCADGWYEIIIDLCTQLEPLAAELERAGEHLEVEQIKSKFGNLRFHVSQRNDAIEAAMQAARQRSIQTCEACGKPGTLAEDEGWWATLCPACRSSDVNAQRFLY